MLTAPAWRQGTPFGGTTGGRVGRTDDRTGENPSGTALGAGGPAAVGGPGEWPTGAATLGDRLRKAEEGDGDGGRGGMHAAGLLLHGGGHPAGFPEEGQGGGDGGGTNPQFPGETAEGDLEPLRLVSRWKAERAPLNLAAACAAELVVLDDAMARTDFERSVVEEIVGRRYLRGGPFVVTTMLQPSEFAPAFGRQAASRLGSGMLVTIIGPDHRLRRAA